MFRGTVCRGTTGTLCEALSWRQSEKTLQALQHETSWSKAAIKQTKNVDLKHCEWKPVEGTTNKL